MARPPFPPLPPREPLAGRAPPAAQGPRPLPAGSAFAGGSAPAAPGAGPSHDAPPLFVPYLPPAAGPPARDPVDEFLLEQQRAAPSLPIILLSSVAGMAAGLIGYSAAAYWGEAGLELSVAAGTLGLCLGIGLTGAALSASTGSRAALPNIAFSCGVILFTLLFFGLCSVVGALAATLFLAWGQ